jgi:uncharacterized damage-inducible protein DinB
MAHPTIDAGLAALNFSRATLTGMIHGIPLEEYCHQPVSGGNHTMWVLGHLADTDDFFLEVVGGKPSACPEGWRDLFHMGSSPLPMLADYPSIEVINQQLHDRREELQTWLTSLTEAEMAEPLPTDFVNFAPNLGTMFCSLACHEGIHIGQITMIRRSLGLAPRFG